uniref:tRNA (guanine(9)-N(1))-methyltransferase n=1 Tax=Parascaris univalens TaxID=6257 RepID=A0A915AYW5_PARUN
MIDEEGRRSDVVTKNGSERSSTANETTPSGGDSYEANLESKEETFNESKRDESVEEIAETAEDTSVGDKKSSAPISKRQTKRERKRARFLEKRKEKRALEKAKRKAKRAAIREAGGVPPPKRCRSNLMSESRCRQRIAIDLSYEKVMNEKQILGTITQLSFCYAANRRAANPTQLAFANFGQSIRTLFLSNKSRTNWDVILEERPLYEAYKREEIVYLTADSDNVLETLDPSKVYVIGGLLDHNSLKGLCLDVAVKEKVAHARLPIDDYVKMRTRKVLTINQVFEILLRYTETHSWKDAFFHVIPKRRIAEGDEKNKGGSGDEHDENGEYAEIETMKEITHESRKDEIDNSVD